MCSEGKFMKKTLFIAFALVFSSLSAMNDTVRWQQIEQKVGNMMDIIVFNSEFPEDTEILSLAKEACSVIPSVGALTSLLLYNTPEELSDKAFDLVDAFKNTFINYVICLLKSK